MWPFFFKIKSLFVTELNLDLVKSNFISPYRKMPAFQNAGIFFKLKKRGYAMQFIQTNANIFDLPNLYSNPSTCAVCVTTNGIIKKDGSAVMGKGIALSANNRYCIAKELAVKLQRFGNHVHRMETAKNCNYHLLTFPTKQDWKNPSSLNLILQSANELISYCDAHQIQYCFLPKPGCSCGQLDWDSQVKPILEPLLDDRFYIYL